MIDWKREIWDRGDTIVIDHDEVKNFKGELITSFTSYKAHASLKAAKDDADGAAVALLETADYTFDDANSRAYAYLETESLSLTLDQDYYLDSQLIDASGNVATMLKRIIVFEQDISQRVVDT